MVKYFWVKDPGLRHWHLAQIFVQWPPSPSPASTWFLFSFWQQQGVPRVHVMLLSESKNSSLVLFDFWIVNSMLLLAYY